MKICILTQPLHTNYGGLLQAYALQKVLRDMGHDVVTDKNGAKQPMSILFRITRFWYHLIKKYIIGDIRFNPFLFLFGFYDKGDHFKAVISRNTNRFIDNHIVTVDFFAGKNAPSKSMLMQFDALVVGSDQIWRPKYSYTPAYFLDFTEGIDIKRISYAASFGNDTFEEYAKNVLNICTIAAKRFDAISVREDSGVELCKKYFGVEAVHLVDPTLLLSKDDYLDLIEEDDKHEQENILTCYVLDKSEEKHNIIKEIADRLNLSLLYVKPERSYEIGCNNLEQCAYPSVSKWLASFRDANFVVTDSFHGTVFSIIFNKPFIAIVNKERGASRFVSLLKLFGLENRLISSLDDINEDIFSIIDFNIINNRKCELIKKSKQFLNASLVFK